MSNNSYEATLIPFLNGIANAIKEKKGYSSSRKIKANDFATEIESITTQPPTGSTFKIHYGTSTPTNTDELWVKTSSLPNNVLLRNTFAGDLTGMAVAQTTLPADPYPVGTSSLCCGAVGNIIYMFGGNGGSAGITPLNTIRAYDVTTGTITTKSPTFSTTLTNACCAVVGTNCYIIGGSGRKIISKYDTVNNTLTETVATLPNISTQLQNAACVAVGTDIFIFGGGIGNSPTNAIYKFDTTNNAVTQMTVILPVALSDLAVAADGTNIYLFGGVNYSGNVVNTIYRYVAGSNSAPQLLEATLSPAVNACRAQGIPGSSKCLIFGGGSGYSTGNPTDIQIFDTITKTVTTAPVSLTTGSSYAGYAMIGNDIYYIGGIAGYAINKVQKITAQVSLDEGTLVITYDANTDNDFKIIDDNTVQLYINPVSAMLGGENDIAQPVKIALYNGSTWVEIN